MAVYSVEGKLGTGKTKFCVWRAQQAMLQGRRVASNVNLETQVLVPHKKLSYVRLPDKPTAFDLTAMGPGNPESYDEDRNGVLILDELGTWLNSRSFQDKDRAGLLDWFIHARKHGWDVYLIVQDAGMIDRQIRDALIEYSCRCIRGDKIKIPLMIGSFLNVFNKKWGYLPKVHMVTARVGYGNPIVAERWMFKGTDLHTAYDTRQVFKADYPHGAFSALWPWDYEPPQHWYLRFRKWLKAPKGPQRPTPRPKLPEVLAIMDTEPPERRIARLRLVA